MRSSMASLAFVFLLGNTLSAEDWPGWRGPRGDGTSQETGIPVQWSRSENVRWKVPIPGTGHSSPIVWGDRVFLTTCLKQAQQRVLLCLDRHTGKMLWQRTVLTAPLEPKHPLNSYASSTPATDGQHVWVSFLAGSDVMLACYDFHGNRMWMRSPGKFYSKHGFCSPPIVYKDLVITNGDHDGDGYLAALDKTTGAPRWRTERPNHTRSYCPPLLIEAAGRMQLVLSGSKCVASYDPDTGKLIWIIDGPTEQFVASLVYLDGVLFLTSGFPEYHILAIRPDGTGNVTQTHVLWRTTHAAGYVPSPIAYGKHFFNVKDDGRAGCWEHRTGQEMWLERLGRHHSASPVEAEGRLYFTDDDGSTFVVRAGPKFEILSRNDLHEQCRASPAIAHGALFIRTTEHLYCITSGDKKRAE
jgi:outer membrane protein assembly factor BamB